LRRFVKAILEKSPRFFQSGAEVFLKKLLKLRAQKEKLRQSDSFV